MSTDIEQQKNPASRTALQMEESLKHQIEILSVDSTPDEDYPLRILKAYRANCDLRVDTNPPEMGIQMNQWQKERAVFLDKAIQLLSEQTEQKHLCSSVKSVVSK